jgi:pimeloyl-ACP methyl ester carboxylesterase
MPFRFERMSDWRASHEIKLSNVPRLRRWLTRRDSGLKGCRMLEWIDKGSATESHPLPLLFVHGGWHAAWCWDDNFLDFFAARGSLNAYSVDDYVDDVRTAASRFDTPPVVVGHSMGGYVVQKYLESKLQQAY